MHTSNIRADQVKVGDTVVFTNTRFNFIVENITPRALSNTELNIEFSYNDETASSVYKPFERLNVIRAGK